MLFSHLKFWNHTKLRQIDAVHPLTGTVYNIAYTQQAHALKCC